jgi:hypothetical protein
MTSINKQLGSIARPEPDIPAATCMKMGPTNSDEAARYIRLACHPERGEHPARKEKLQAIRRGLGIPARTSQHRDS